MSEQKLYMFVIILILTGAILLTVKNYGFWGVALILAGLIIGLFRILNKK